MYIKPNSRILLDLIHSRCHHIDGSHATNCCWLHNVTSLHCALVNFETKFFDISVDCSAFQNCISKDYPKSDLFIFFLILICPIQSAMCHVVRGLLYNLHFAIEITTVCSWM